MDAMTRMLRSTARGEHACLATRALPRRRFMALGVLLTLAACSSSPHDRPDPVAGLDPAGYVTMHQAEAAVAGHGGVGHLFFQGTNYRFTVVGLTGGGIGSATLDIVGEVYRLNDITQFPGAYALASDGPAAGKDGAWLRNDAGVYLHLKARGDGRIDVLGGSAVVISMAP